MDKPAIWACTWLDAHGSDGTISPHEVDHSPYTYTTVGYLLRSDNVGVSLAFESTEDNKFRDVTFIPRVLVVKETQLYPKPKVAKRVQPPINPIPDDLSSSQSQGKPASTDGER